MKKNQNIAKQYSENELSGITDSDVFIWLTDESGHTLYMEFGAALILNKKFNKPMIFVVGEATYSPWLFNSRVNRRNSIDEVIDEISRMDH